MPKEQFSSVVTNYETGRKRCWKSPRRDWMWTEQSLIWCCLVVAGRDLWRQSTRLALPRDYYFLQALPQSKAADCSESENVDIFRLFHVMAPHRPREGNENSQ